jgi:O-antigen ligase
VTALRRVLLAAFVLGLGFSITLSETALLLLALLWLWRLREPGHRRAEDWPLLGPVVTFGAATLLSALASPEPATSLLASRGVLLMAALYVTVDALEDEGAARRFVSGLMLVGAAAAALGLLQVAVCPGPQSRGEGLGWLAGLLYHRCARARGPFSIYMTLAGVLTLVLLAGLPRLLPGPGRARGLALPWLVMLAGLVATYTRGAWLGFAAGALALLPTVRRGRLLVVAGLAGLVVLLLAGSPGLRQRLLSMGDPEEATIKERAYMWRSGWAMAREHPALGLGPGGIKREYWRYARPEAIKHRTGHVHNTPLQILVERGALGLLAWLWIWAAFYRRAIGLLRRLPAERAEARALVAGSVAAVTGFLVAGLSEYNFGDSEVVLVAWALMALPFVVARGAGRGDQYT